MRVDLTINIPTMISIIVLIISTSATGIGFYYALDKRQMATDFQVSELSRRVDKNESSVAALKQDTILQNASLRGEMKADISDIKEMLNRLIFAPQQQVQQQRQQQLKEWSK